MAYIFIFTCNIKFTSKHVGTFTYMKFSIYEIIYLSRYSTGIEPLVSIFSGALTPRF